MQENLLLTLSLGRKSISILYVIYSMNFAHALPNTDTNTSVRAVGMGNAYLGVVEDADSMFYNPAGLARVGGVNWRIVDVQVGASGIEAYEDFQDLQNDSTFDTAIQNLYGDHIWVGANAASAFTFKGFGFMVYDTVDASLAIHNPVYPNIEASVINDLGYTLGVGLPILPVFHAGFNFKYIQRLGSRTTLGPTFIANGDTAAIQDELLRSGKAYGLDFGANIIIPGPLQAVFAFVWKDIGNTTFKNDDTTALLPPRNINDMSVGFAMNIDAVFMTVSPAIDFRYVNRDDVQLSKKINLGLELGLPLVDIRAGFHQGYYTYGAGIGLGPIQIEAASYGVELGEYAGQIEDRRYMIEATIELGIPSLGFLSGEGSGGGKDGKGGGIGGRRLKQRR